MALSDAFRRILQLIVLRLFWWVPIVLILLCFLSYSYGVLYLLAIGGIMYLFYDVLLVGGFFNQYLGIPHVIGAFFMLMTIPLEATLLVMPCYLSAERQRRHYERVRPRGLN